MNDKRIRRWFVLCMFILLSSCKPYPSPNGELSFSSRSSTPRGLLLPGYFGIYRFNSKARSIDEMERITPEKLDAGSYDWSSDGEWLFFMCEQSEEWEGICRIDKEGEDFEVLLTEKEFGNPIGFFGNLSISPDRSKLVFGSILHEYDPPKAGIFIFYIKSKTIENIQLLDTGIGSVSWSPDGDKLVLKIDPFDIYLLDIETMEMEFLTYGWFPTWSPDGSKISYTQDILLNTISIVDRKEEIVVDQEGICPGWDGHTWTPDGKFIVFISRCGESEPENGLYIVNVETGKVYELYTKDVLINDPQWIP
jgi:Tol biopolymer transport system component